MSATDTDTTPAPQRRLRAVVYATTLLVGGGVVGAIIAGPTFGQGMMGQGTMDQGMMGRGADQGSEQGYGPGRGGPDGPRWRRFMDRQQGEDDGPAWRRRFGGHRFGGERFGDDDGPGIGARMGQGMGPGVGQGMGQGMDRMMYPGAIERRVNRVLGIVDASTEQKQKVRAIFEKAASDLYAMRDKRQENRRAMAEALAAATIDRAKIEQLRGDRMKLADATSKRLTDAMVEAAEVLTPAQRADLAARFQRRRGG
jgi:Spy/CpxP family protein refolding chaperone